MKLQHYFLLTICVQLPVLGAAAWLAYPRYIWLVYGIEVVVLLEIVLAAVYYRKMRRPLRTLADALSLLKSQDWNVALRRVGQPEVDDIVEVFNRMTERLHRQQILYQEQQHFLSLLVEEAPTGVIVADSAGVPRMMNPAAQRLADNGFTIPEVRDGQSVTVRTAGRALRVSRHHFIDRGIRCSFWLVDDLTAELGDAERQAYGRCVRMISHEVNNTVAAIVTALDLVSTPQTAELIGAIDTRTRQLSDFIGAAASVFKVPEPVKVAQPLGAFAEAQRPLLQSICTAAHAEFVIESDAPATVSIDAAQIAQVLVNIVRNSCQAGATKVTLNISGSSLSVSDNGRGISPESQERLFTPFFTTKAGGQGIGLTLAAEILRGHQAAFTLHSSKGLTAFSIKFR